MLQLQDLLAPTDVLVISDEVYEHMVFDGQQHQSASRFPALAARSLHRVQLRQDLPRHRLEGRLRGGAGAPCRPSSARCTSSTCSPSTRRCSTAWPRTWPTRSPTCSCRPSTSASATCSAPAWRAPNSACCPARAATSSAWTSPRSATCRKRSSAKWLTREIGVAAIPLSAFYGEGFDQRVVRFCFAKKRRDAEHGAGAARAAVTRLNALRDPRSA
jgi:methionine aminotransferase